jgi:hypothetical protein
MAYGLGNMAGGYAQGLEQTRARSDALRQQAFANTMAQQGMALEKEQLELQKRTSMNNLKMSWLDLMEKKRASQAAEDAAELARQDENTHFTLQHDLDVTRTNALVDTQKAQLAVATNALDFAKTQQGWEEADRPSKIALDAANLGVVEAERTLKEAQATEYANPDSVAARKAAQDAAAALAKATAADAAVKQGIAEINQKFIPTLAEYERTKLKGEAELPGAQAAQGYAGAAYLGFQKEEGQTKLPHETALMDAQATYYEKMADAKDAGGDSAGAASDRKIGWLIRQGRTEEAETLMLQGQTGLAQRANDIRTYRVEAGKAEAGMMAAVKALGGSLDMGTEGALRGQWVVTFEEVEGRKKVELTLPLDEFLSRPLRTGQDPKPMAELLNSYSLWKTYSGLEQELSPAGAPESSPAAKQTGEAEATLGPSRATGGEVKGKAPAAGRSTALDVFTGLLHPGLGLKAGEQIRREAVGAIGREVGEAGLAASNAFRGAVGAARALKKATDVRARELEGYPSPMTGESRAMYPRPGTAGLPPDRHVLGDKLTLGGPGGPEVYTITSIYEEDGRKHFLVDGPQGRDMPLSGDELMSNPRWSSRLKKGGRR